MPGPYPDTPDGRYFVVRGRLWRKADPGLPEPLRRQLVDRLMDARRQVGRAKRAADAALEASARAEVDRVKRELGERGPVWWTDGAADFNWHKVKTTPYAAWYETLPPGADGSAGDGSGKATP